MDLARVDEEISRQKSITRKLYSKRNSLAAISRLPIEVLKFIFIKLACESFYRYSPPCATDWFRISHVSSHWRHVALNCPLLWSYIFPASQRWVDVLLERSDEVPLKIRIDLTRDRADSCRLSPFIEKIVQYAERIEELNFYTFFWDEQNSQCFYTLYSSASHLRVLDFSLKRPWGYSSDRDEPIPSPRHFYKLGSLTTLSLRLINTYPPFQYDVLGFQVVLSHMPDLVNLYLDDSLASANDLISSAELNALEKIDLPRLSRLSVDAPLSTIIVFLSSVNIPVRTQIRLDSSNHKENSMHDNYDQFCSVLAQHYSSDRVSSLPTVYSVVMNLRSGHFRESSLIFSMSPNRECPSGSLRSLKYWASHVLLEITNSPSESSDTRKLGTNICAFMPTKNVQTLHIGGPPACQTFWRTIFRHFPGLRRMKISGGSMGDDLVSSFLPHITDKSLGNRGRPLALEELTLENMKLKLLADRVDPWKALKWLPIDETDDGLPPFEGLQLLCSALSAHAASRGRLMLTRSYLDTDVNDLYGMVGKWEGGQFYVVRERFWS